MPPSHESLSAIPLARQMAFPNPNSNENMPIEANSAQYSVEETCQLVGEPVPASACHLGKMCMANQDELFTMCVGLACMILLRYACVCVCS